MTIVETERLILRKITVQDAEAICALLNEPSFLENIGDRKVRTIADAEKYITERIAASYERHGYGLYLVCVKGTQVAVGICGLVKRDSLSDADIGFAFFPQHWRQGYAVESAGGVLRYAKEKLGLVRVLGITKVENASSVRVLEKLGLQFEKMILMPGESVEIRLYSKHL